MSRATLQRDTAWLRSNPGLGVALYDLLNHRPQPNPPSPGVPRTAWRWDPRRPGWRMTVTLPCDDLRPEQGSGHPTGGG